MNNCPICGGSGYWFKEWKDEGGIPRSSIVICSCRINELKSRYKKDCGITPHMQLQTFENFDLSFYTGDKKARAINAVTAAKLFADDFIAGKNPGGIIFLGSVGSGKTFLASAIANAVTDNMDLKEYQETVRVIVIPDLLDEIRASFKDNSSLREETIMNKVKDAPLLIFDDLGADNSSDFAVRIIFGILNYRINYELPTIITTNLSYKQIEEVYGSRICSRLSELCRFYPLESDKDIRVEKKLRARK